MKKETVFAFILAFTSLSAEAGIFEPFVVWNKPLVSVCFVDRLSQVNQTEFALTKKNETSDFSIKDFSSTEKELIQKVISEQYTREITGIEFSGWKNCSEAPESDAYLVRVGPIKKWAFDKAPAFKGRSSIGEGGLSSAGGFREKSQKKPAVWFNFISPGVAVHEFGHLAGLRHEHINAEADNDPQCWQYGYSLNVTRATTPTKNDWLFVKKSADGVYPSTIVYTEYDPRSVMNYCYMKINRREFTAYQLSEKDQQTLRFIYQ